MQKRAQGEGRGGAKLTCNKLRKRGELWKEKKTKKKGTLWGAGNA